MTREELKAHCLKQIEGCEMWARYKGEEPHGKVYEEHKLILELLEQEPTTKNDLAVDKEQLKTMIRGLTKWYVKRDNTEVGEPNTAVGLLYDDVMFGIDGLSPVTPQPRWFPVSERLPEKNGNYLVTIKTSDGTANITFQMVDHFGPGWLHEEKTRKVIAWMPLPKPYEPQESEGA